MTCNIQSKPTPVMWVGAEAPQAVVATAATSVTDHGFTAHWNPATGATSYRLDVATDIDFISFVPGYNDLNVGNVTSEAVTGLTPGETYYYRVRAVNAGGTSGNSNRISVTDIPAAPVATAATSVTANGFSANWNSSTGATSYRLDVSTSSSFSSFVAGYNDLNVGNVTTYAVAGLAAGTTYYFRVRAVDVGGTSGDSNTISTITVPAAPLATAATSVTDTGFTANWNSSTGATSYRLDVSTSNTFSSFVTGYNNLNVGNVTTYAVTGLTTGTTYYYRLRAVDAGGTGANSNTISVTLNYDSEVVDWIARVIANGGTVSTATKNATNTFMLSIKAVPGLRAKLLHLNLFAGDQVAAALVPLIKDIGSSVDTANLNGGGGYAESTGIYLGSGSGAGDGYISSGVHDVSSGGMGDNDLHLGIYMREKVPAAAIVMGGGGGGAGTGDDYIYFTGSSAVLAMYSLAGDLTVSDSVLTGHYVATRPGSGLFLYRNGTQTGTNASPGSSRGDDGISICTGALAPNPYWVGASTTAKCGAYHIGKALTSSDVAALYSPLQAFQTALARQV